MAEGEHLFHPRRVPPESRALGGYRLIHELGAGGMATLYLATDAAGRLVAVKRLHPHLARERAFLEMFSDEAMIAARISHPNVCRVFGLEQVSGQLFLVMEYVHGESLAALSHALHRGTSTFPVELALHLVGQACLGLHAAHEQTDAEGHPLQVVHRDISPQNLLVTYEGELKVVDFGIASALARLHHTEVGLIKGKPAYMAPEQARGDGAVDRRADIFALGAVLYELLCGVRCFAGDSPIEVLRRVQAGDVTPPREYRPELPSVVEALLVRALAPRPEERFATAEELYRHVDRAIFSVGADMSARAIGDLMRRTLARRYAIREELRALAFAAPEVLEDEDLEATLIGMPQPPLARCEYCGAGFGSPELVLAHVDGCEQRAWWERNVAALRPAREAGDPEDLRQRFPAPGEQHHVREGLWQRLRRRLGSERRAPIVVRLETVNARLGRVHDHVASQLAARAMAALLSMVAEISEARINAAPLLERLKPKLMGCANVALRVTLEAETGAAFLSYTTDRDLAGEVSALEKRLARAGSEKLRGELGQEVQRKRALTAERERVAVRRERLLSLLEFVVDAVELTHAKVLEVVASPAMGESQADTQISVFLESLLRDVELEGAALHEADAALDP
ncbi:MAG: serine/threonine protein kinase [Deltaproteobacteria bacterium]|nr:serine/threonine protein kinase [Deltaproteobacteria bacterium]